MSEAVLQKCLVRTVGIEVTHSSSDLRSGRDGMAPSLVAQN